MQKVYKLLKTDDVLSLFYDDASLHLDPGGMLQLCKVQWESAFFWGFKLQD